MSADRLTLIFERLFGKPAAADIVAGASQGHGAWDSIAHINLILTVEQEFGITFSPEEAGMTTSFEAMRELIGQKTEGVGEEGR